MIAVYPWSTSCNLNLIAFECIYTSALTLSTVRQSRHTKSVVVKATDFGELVLNYARHKHRNHEYKPDALLVK